MKEILSAVKFSSKKYGSVFFIYFLIKIFILGTQFAILFLLPLCIWGTIKKLFSKVFRRKK